MDPIKSSTGPIPAASKAPPPAPAPAPRATPSPEDMVASATKDAFHAVEVALEVPTLSTLPPPPPPARRSFRVSELTSGHADYNVYELNSWVAHATEANKDKFITTQEGRLLRDIKAQAKAENKKLTFHDVFEISLSLNGGNVSSALLTMHNAFRQVARGNVPFEAKLTMKHPDFKELKEDHAFFSTYLDGSSIGLGSNPVDAPGAWYHSAVTATVSFVSKEKGSFDAMYEAGTAKNTEFFGHSSALVGQMINRLPGGLLDGTATVDLVGEQVIGLFVSRGIASDVPEEIRAEVAGLAFGSVMSAIVR